MVPEPERATELPTAEETIDLVERWLRRSAGHRADANAERLAGLLQDPQGLEFTIGFVDRVVRPEDLRIAARNLEALSRQVPDFLPWFLRLAVVVGGGFGILLPWPIIPIARAVFRRMVGHLVVDAHPRRLGRTLARLRDGGARLNVNLLGEAVLGEREAERRLDGTRALLARDDVDYVSIKVSSVVSQLSMWGFEHTVDRVIERLIPLYQQAAEAPTAKFINLDMEEFRDLDLTIAVFTRLLEREEFRQLEAGIVLQAYLPDSLGALEELTSWARNRRREGGAGIKVRIVKGANLAMERVDAAIHGWPLATWPSKTATDAHYKRLLDYALRPRNAEAVRVGVAGHNLFDLAFAWLLAEKRGVTDRVDIEMLLGMASAHQEALRAQSGGILLYPPVVHGDEFDSAISYLVRRLEENSSAENFLSGAFELDDPAIFEREAHRFRSALALLDASIPESMRTQNRMTPDLPWSRRPFDNEPDTDPSRAPNRAWAAAALERSLHTTLGSAALEDARIDTEEALRACLSRAARAGRDWGSASTEDRAALLERVGDALAASRGRLVEVMAAETGKTVAEADVEVSEAVDFARYYAERARDLDAVEGARFVPAGVILVTPPWNFPVSIPAGGVLAALAAGSAAILKPAPQARRCGAVLAEAIWEAGVPRDLFSFVDVEEGELGQQLVTAPEVGRVVLTGGFETAALFRSWKHDLPLLAETSGKNAIIITPSADLDLAVGDLVKSAFGNAGQKCSAASLAILVGSVARSERFRRQLTDAVASLAVGPADDPATLVGPLVEPPHGKLERALTELDEGESWLVRPRQLDGTDRLWSPGVRDQVAPGSTTHRVEFFGPVLGLMAASDLDDAIALQNDVDFGLTAGIHSLDPNEVAHWLAEVEAGNLYVNRPITGAIVRRQPFGGWKRSSVGTGAKAGGPNTLFVLGDWEPVAEEPDGDLRLDALDDRVRAVVEAVQPALDYVGFDLVRRGALRDAEAWDAEFGIARDASELGVERNVLRYRPTAVELRLAAEGSVAEFARLMAAAALARSPLTISSSRPLPATLVPLLDADFGELRTDRILIESDAAWIARMRDERPHRIRLVAPAGAGAGAGARAGAEAGAGAGALAAELRDAIEGDPDVALWAGPVTTAGRIELLTFLREQAVSVTAHRFGNPAPGFLDLRL